VPKRSQHLLSVHKLCKDNNCHFICDAFGFGIQDKITGNVLLKGLCRAGLYPIPFSFLFLHSLSFQIIHFVILVNRSTQVSSTSVSVILLTQSSILKQSQISFTSNTSKFVCTTCLEGKLAKLHFPYPVVKSVKPLEVIHSDVWRPSPTVSVDGFRYYVSFIDECTRFTWIFPMINKGEVYSIFVYFHTFLVTQFSATLQVFQSDGGGEYLSNKFKHYLLTKGIIHQMSCPYTPKQNGLVERKHRHILETTITLFQTAHLPSKFWVMLVLLPFIWLIECPIKFFNSNHHISCYMVLHRLLLICEFLVVLVFLYSSLIILTSFSPRLPLVFFWGMQVSIKGIFVFLFAPIISLSLDMFYFMNPCFLTLLWFMYPLPLPHPLVYIPLCSLLFLLLLQRLHLSLHYLPVPLLSLHCLTVPPHSLHCLRLCPFCHLHSPLSLLILTSSLRIYVWSYLFHRWIFIPWPPGLRMVSPKGRLTLPLYNLLLLLRLNPIPSRLPPPFLNGSLLCRRSLMLFMHKVLGTWCLSHLPRILLAVNGST